MSDEAGFLKAIAEQPTERSTRLVYADWLDEHNRSREADFLRLQIQVAELNAKLLELGEQLDAKWLATVGSVAVNPSDLKLSSGRSIRMNGLRQFAFYAGLLEGLPTREMNRNHIDGLVHQEETRSGNRPYLIEPPTYPIEVSKEGIYRRLTPESVPSVACVGDFDSFQPARDSHRDGSALTIIWFQHEWAFPIDPVVREQIRAIDWEKHAHDFDW